ncbi:MAG: DUF131 domain-containing protein [Candidatus Thorarchaeota archaeon]|jgi:uncharacterized membrane protein
MQIGNFTDLIAWALIIIGCIIIFSGIASMVMRSDIEGVEKRRESKGVILLGPIPIVWGFGKRGWIIAAVVAITLFLIVFFWRF